MSVPYGTRCCAAKSGPSRRLLFLAAALLVAGIARSSAADPPQPPIKLLTLGDSLTAGYGLPHDDSFEVQLQKALQAAGRNVVIEDGGVSGDTSAGGLARLDWMLVDHPDAAIVELGANDGLRGISPHDMGENLTAILDKLQAARIPVLLSGMFAPPNLGSDYGTEFRDVFDRLGRRPGILYDPFFLEGVAADPMLNQADHMHPNADGVHRIVRRLLPLAEKLLDQVSHR